MRSFLDVITDVQDGKDVDKEELRVALLFCNDQRKFSEKSLERMIRIAKGNTNFPPLQLKAINMALEGRIDCRRKAMEAWFDGEIPGVESKEEYRIKPIERQKLRELQGIPD